MPYHEAGVHLWCRKLTFLQAHMFVHYLQPRRCCYAHRENFISVSFVWLRQMLTIDIYILKTVSVPNPLWSSKEQCKKAATNFCKKVTTSWFGCLFEIMSGKGISLATLLVGYMEMCLWPVVGLVSRYADKRCPNYTGLCNSTHAGYTHFFTQKIIQNNF